MISDEERREVAKRLRDKNRERNQPGMFEPQDMGMMAYNCLYLKGGDLYKPVEEES